MTAAYSHTARRSASLNWGYAFRSSGFADSHFLQKHVNWNRVPLYAGPILRLWLFILLDKALMETKVAENERVGTSNGTPPLLHPILSSRAASLSINARNAGYDGLKLGEANFSMCHFANYLAELFARYLA